MVLPSDMQIAPVVLLKRDVEKIDSLARSQRMSRSAFLRTLIADALASFSLPDCSLAETKESTKEPSASVA